MAKEEPYFVEVDTNGCGTCGHGRTWTVIGPDGVASSTSWEVEDEADAYADHQNDAYWSGRESGRRMDAEREAVFRRVIEHRNVLLVALKALLCEPYGCSLCDSGTPRNTSKGHQPDCPYELARGLLRCGDDVPAPVGSHGHSSHEGAATAAPSAGADKGNTPDVPLVDDYVDSWGRVEKIRAEAKRNR